MQLMMHRKHSEASVSAARASCEGSYSEREEEKDTDGLHQSFYCNAMVGGGVDG